MILHSIFLTFILSNYIVQHYGQEYIIAVPNSFLKKNQHKKHFKNKNNHKFLKYTKCLTQYINDQQYLKKFRESDCSPVIIVPGYMGTKLQLRINCNFLKRSHPDIFFSCGWKQCQQIFSFMDPFTPDQQYTIWISPKLILYRVLENPEKRKCFGNLFSLSYQEKSGQFKQNLGVNITWFGNTPETYYKYDCGYNALGNYLQNGIITDIMQQFQGNQCQLSGYSQLLSMLSYMGYLTGITMQPIPYDFRYGLGYANYSQVVKNAIIKMAKMTGKKVILMSHSYGCLISLKTLNEDKQLKNEIKQLVLIGPPLLGETTAIKDFLVGQNKFFISNSFQYLSFGINFEQQKQIFRSGGSIFDMFPFPILDYENESWYKLMKQRIKYEEGQIQQNPIKWFPEKDQNCYQQSIGKSKCKLGIINMQKNPFFIIQNKQYYLRTNDLQQLYQKYLTQFQIHLFKQQSLRTQYRKLIQQPNVPITILYSNAYDTDYSFNFKHHYPNQKWFQIPDIIIPTQGDGTVNGYNILLPAIKWITQNKSKVQLIQYCSTYKKHQNKLYSGIQCTCHTQQEECSHACIESQPYFLQWFGNRISKECERIQNYVMPSGNQIIVFKQNCCYLKNC